MGFCGGYQMLGESISDPEGVEEGGTIRGLGLLPVNTVLRGNKTTLQTEGEFAQVEGFFSCLSGRKLKGYEIHMGETALTGGGRAFVRLEAPRTKDGREDTALREDGAICGDVCGSYVHGIFDGGDVAYRISKALADRKGVLLETPGEGDYQSFKESQYDLLAQEMRKHMDMKAVYAMLRDAAI